MRLSPSHLLDGLTIYANEDVGKSDGTGRDACPANNGHTRTFGFSLFADIKLGGADNEEVTMYGNLNWSPRRSLASGQVPRSHYI